MRGDDGFECLRLDGEDKVAGGGGRRERWDVSNFLAADRGMRVF